MLDSSVSIEIVKDGGHCDVCNQYKEVLVENGKVRGVWLKSLAKDILQLRKSGKEMEKE
jgi:hypothetical protein